MYSVMLMAALTTGASAPDCHYHSSCCGYSYGCCGGYYSHGCCGGYYSHGCCGYSYGCCGYSYGCCGGCYGSYSYGCCGGCCGGVIYTPPVVPPAETIPAPKTEEPKKSGALPANIGRLIVELPADAKLFLDGQLMKAATERRNFRTPELIPGQQYFYDLRAEVVIDGKTEVESRQVIVQAGVTAQVSFSKLTAAVQASKTLAANK